MSSAEHCQCVQIHQLLISEIKYILKSQFVCNNVGQMQEAGHGMAIKGNCLNMFAKLYINLYQFY